MPTIQVTTEELANAASAVSKPAVDLDAAVGTHIWHGAEEVGKSIVHRGEASVHDLEPAPTSSGAPA